jgi:tRNA-splicing ligase RtcB (3'-phosphate/5'-hydroxy nucleic acid ligase)
MTLDPRLSRLDENRVRIDNPYGIDAVLFANESVPVETAAVTELVRMLDLSRTVERIAEAVPASFDTEPAVTQVAVTPDFHKGHGIPVGTVMATRGFLVPQSIGNDINCGMRLHLTSLHSDDLQGRVEELESAFRHLFFEGGRNIPMTREQRAALLTHGLTGLLEATPRSLTEGAWSLFHELDMEGELARVDRRGSLEAGRIFGLDDWMGPAGQLSRDSQIGSIGGGNHFVEIQRVEQDPGRHHRACVGLPSGHGDRDGAHRLRLHRPPERRLLSRRGARNLYPAGLRHPENGIFVLPDGPRHAGEAALFWDALHNAGNFAFANRLFLALTALAGLRRVLGDVDYRLLYDAPHNFIWREERGRRDVGHPPQGGVPRARPTRRWGEPRSSTTASRCWCPAPWAPAASYWRARGIRRRSPAPATAPGARSPAATRCVGTRRSSSAFWSGFAWSARWTCGGRTCACAATSCRRSWRRSSRRRRTRTRGSARW